MVLEPKDHEASCKYGANAKWCISMKNNKHYWDDYYNKNEIRHLFIIDFVLDTKYAITIFPHEKGKVGALTSWDQLNNEMHEAGARKLISRYKITKKMLENPIKPKTWAWFYSVVGIENVKINGDKVDVHGDVNLSNMNITSLQFEE